ncbi:MULTISPECIES: hypothetical protein [Clostridium]|jgi:hypothetical protein|uniref:hypothetical protein n=1 Tax=Clostridium TaxID=1485 RepID=UPI00232D6E4E|nr:MULTISPECIES: hypothetical protein [Clostridium]MDB1933042.1 hypothetical protein [Clostridium tertium]MDB1938850.1 hypothetical protein [Clostridium tertium]MDI9215768.1 hypothetical protein [Clostridium tertium]MDU2157572.1 hypothetical protein [Clostridium sp.]MDY4605662.1 hypothetical protein [Clostridium tertium]
MELDKNSRKKWRGIEIVGLALVIISFITLLVSPESISGLFDSITKQVFPIVVDVFLLSEVGVAIIISVIVGRILERLGFTDALIRIFIPIMKIFKVNPSVIIPSVYNVLGDINAAGAISGPVLKKARATKAEQKIAIATMIQSPQSFATLVLGIVALTKFGISALPLVLISVFLPIVLVPIILSKTVYRDTKAVELEELPRFTPETKLLDTIFSSAKEGAYLLFLVIIPAVASVFTIIGILDFFGIWTVIQSGMTTVLQWLSIEPVTGIVSVLASPTLAMAQLNEMSNIAPALVVGGFVLANSGLPLSVLFGQIPVTWKENSDLNEKEALLAGVLGTAIKFVSCLIIGLLLTPLII